MRRFGTRAKLIEPGTRFGFLRVLGFANRGRKHKVLRWLCQCDCGEFVIVGGDKLRQGINKSCGCKNPGHARGPKSARWKGGKFHCDNGYVMVRWPKGVLHNTTSRYVYEHVLVMMRHLGRSLVKGELVHHRNGVKSDNRLENLELWTSSHPTGQRVEDKVQWAIQILKQYKPAALAGEMVVSE